MQNPISVEGLVLNAVRQALGNEAGFTIAMERGHAIGDNEYPIAIITFDSSDIRPRLSGEDPKFAAVAGSRFVHRYYLDISVRNAALSRLLAHLDAAFGAAAIFNAANSGIVMVFDGAEGIARTEDMRDDIRSIRLRIRCEST